MRAVARQRIGPHQQDTHRALPRFFGCFAQQFWIIGDAIRQTLVIEAGIRVLKWRLVSHRIANHGMGIACVSVNQKGHHPSQIGLRACQPVLERQKIGTHVLRGTGDETEQAGQPAQHGHLLCTRRAAGFVSTAAQALE